MIIKSQILFLYGGILIMGILTRFGDIMKSNVNALLDKCEDPAKMVDQTLRDLNTSLAQVKRETAAVMAEEKRNKRIVDDLQSSINTYDSTARKALASGNEADARTMLEKKAEKQAQLETAKKTYDLAKANADKMRQMHDKLVSDINTLNGKRAQIKAQVSMAKAQERVNKATSGINTTASMAAFDRMEAKAQQMLDAATSEAELNVDESTDEAQDIVNKYGAGSSSAVDDELARMRAEMGL